MLDCRRHTSHLPPGERPHMFATWNPFASCRPGRDRVVQTLSLLLLLTFASSALAARGGMRTTPTPEATGASAGTVAGSNMEELRLLMEAERLTELRTTYNGNYGASLLFYPDTLNYYIALFRDRDFWRVIKTSSVEEAERLYRTFVDQTEELAQVYIDTVRLEAGKQYTEQLVSLNEQRLQSLQREMDAQRQQSVQVNAALQQARQQAASLSTDLRASHQQLDTLNQRIESLQAQQANPELILPSQPQPEGAPPTTAQPLPEPTP